MEFFSRKWDRKRVEKVLEGTASVISSVSEILIHIKKPTLLGASLVAARSWQSYKKFSNDAFHSTFDGWEKDYSLMSFTFIDLLRDNNLLRSLGTNINGTVMSIATLEGQEMGVKYNITDAATSHLFFPRGSDIKECRNKLLNLYWRSNKNSIYAFASTNNGKVSCCFSGVDDTKTYPSKFAEKIRRHIQSLEEPGYCRAVLLHGKPGTGKTQIMRHIALSGDYRTIVASAQFLNRTYPGIITRKPDVVLIDDIDRNPPNDILEILDKLKEKCKIVMVSVNDIKKLDPALLRSGRFDDIFEVESLDPEITQKILEGVPPDLQEQLQALPIAYLAEFQRQKDRIKDVDLVQLTKSLIAREALVHKLTEAQKDIELAS